MLCWHNDFIGYDTQTETSLLEQHSKVLIRGYSSLQDYPTVFLHRHSPSAYIIQKLIPSTHSKALQCPRLKTLLMSPSNDIANVLSNDIANVSLQ
ncbi:hypothetical protein M8J75_007165 [Diaphorina citri]|nr:hypothetical protein M8J75_007165 [Diaphorina citri]KAI5751565.1 hypothetical protein M8J77_008712 [Diaphorina citri]